MLSGVIEPLVESLSIVSFPGVRHSALQRTDRIRETLQSLFATRFALAGRPGRAAAGAFALEGNVARWRE
jgi:hypothetical protein